MKKSDANTEYQTSNTNANLGRGWWHCQILAAAAAAGMAVRWCSAAAAAAAAQTRMRMRTPSRLVMSMGCPARTMALEHTNKQTNKQANKHMHVSTTARSSVSHTTLVCSGAARAVEDRVAAHRLQIFHRPLNVPKRSSQGLRRLYSVTCVCMCVCVLAPELDCLSASVRDNCPLATKQNTQVCACPFCTRYLFAVKAHGCQRADGLCTTGDAWMDGARGAGVSRTGTRTRVTSGATNVVVCNKTVDKTDLLQAVLAPWMKTRWRLGVRLCCLAFCRRLAFRPSWCCPRPLLRWIPCWRAWQEAPSEGASRTPRQKKKRGAGNGGETTGFKHTQKHTAPHLACFKKIKLMRSITTRC